MPSRASVDFHDTRVICSVGFLAAASFATMNLRLPMPGAPFLVYEPSDVAALVASFTMGPAAGAAVVVLRNLMRAFVNPEIVGLICNTLASCSYVMLAGWLYARRRTQMGAVLALSLATLAQAALMIALNVVVLPLYLGLTGPALARMLGFFILPFNLFKGAANGVLVYVLYKRVSGYFPRSARA